MRIKSFYANTVEAAVALARRELGAEAMLVESRKAPLEARHLGEYEVVCAVVPEAEPAALPQAEAPAVQDARLAAELAEMRHQLDMMGKTITRSAWSGAHWSAAGPEMSEWHAALMAEDIDGAVVDEILGAIERKAPDGGALQNSVGAELERRIQVNAALAASSGAPAIAALVGPPGAGKTTMLAKLAVTCGLAVRRPVRLLSIDDYRVAGAEQLRSFATILGAPFQSFDSIGALAQALPEPHGNALILVDTPGYGPHDIDRAADLAGFLTSRPGIGTHLVLTASMKSADLTHVAERYDIFRPSSLLFTRVDETSSFGTAFSLSVRRAKPLSYLGTGQVIPDDIDTATKARILSLIWPRTRPLAQRAA